jgi:hypothetical protein
MTTALSPEIQILLDRTRTPQRERVLAVQGLRGSNAAGTHGGRGSRSQTRRAAINESLKD